MWSSRSPVIGEGWAAKNTRRITLNANAKAARNPYPWACRANVSCSMRAVGETGPDVGLRSDDGRRMSMKDCRGNKVALYFYPWDDTPGCTKEACSFRDNHGLVTSKGAVVLGVSRNDAASHGKFRDKYHLNFPLLSDDEGKVTEAYGVWKKKNLYGRQHFGIERTTF